jgi:serine/threonine protein kinase
LDRLLVGVRNGSDRKTGNVFLDDKWEPRIADFGLAKIVTNSVKMTMAIGSPMFMAPELFDDDDSPSFAVDVYAFGMLIYTMFTNQQIFKPGEKPPRGPQQLMMKVAKGERLMRPEGVPDLFWNLITKCWSQAPAERPSFQELVNMMLTSDEYVFAGTDMAKYREYRERIKPPPEEPEQKIASTGSLPKVGLRMSDLGDGGSELFTKLLGQSMKRVDKTGDDPDFDQAFRRYDFTRSSLRRK